MKRPDGVTIIAVYHWLLAVLSVFGICGVIFGMFAAIASGERGVIGALLGLTMALFFVVASVVINVLVGWGLWRLKPWARIAAIVLAIFHLPAFPIGTLIGVLILWYLLADPDAKAAFGVT